jgi:hypothetical protein
VDSLATWIARKKQLTPTKGKVCFVFIDTEVIFIYCKRGEILLRIKKKTLKKYENEKQLNTGITQFKQ